MPRLFDSQIREAKGLYKHLTQVQRKNVMRQLGAVTTLSFVELVVAGGVSLLAASLADPNHVKSTILKWSGIAGIPIEQFFSFGDVRLIPLTLSVVVTFSILVKNGMACLTTWRGATLAEDVAQSMGVKLFNSYIERSYLWHCTQNPADLQQKLIWRSQVAIILNAYNNLLTQLLTVLVLFVALFVAMPGATLLVFAVTGGAASLTYACLKKPSERRSQHAVAEIRAANKTAMAALNGIREVLIYRQQQSFVELFSRQARKAGHLNAIKPLISSFPVWLLETVGFAMLATTLIIMVLIVEANPAELTGTMALLAAVAWRLLPAMNKTVGSSLVIRSQYPYIAPMLKILDEGVGGASDREETRPVSLINNISFNGVSFRYPEGQNDALNGISLQIPRGSMVGFVGPSGSGKTTLTSLLCGLIQPTSGHICVDDVMLEKCNQRSWLQSIGYVPQAPYLLDGSLVQNIAFSDWGQSIDRERVQECCRMAAIDFLDQLPDGVDTNIGERGVRLSGGQIQRVAIARALYSNPDCIIFDEATSALDSASEREIQTTINNLKKHTTCILIAHRLSTLEQCDTIYVIKKGRIDCSGEPSQVLAAYASALEKE